MIIEWLKRKRAAAITEEEKRQAAYNLQHEQEIEKETAEWREKYFRDIVFPVVILAKKDYATVSEVAEYFYDTDINIWFVKSDYELIDSNGDKYDFQQIENEHWVPDKKIGTMEFEELKNRLIPLIYMPNHKKNINSPKTIKELLELLMTE